MAKYLFFDTETTGLPNDYNAPYTETDNWPRLVQLAYIFTDDKGKALHEESVIIKPFGYKIPDGMIHGISNWRANKFGVMLSWALGVFRPFIKKADKIICHNYDFDSATLGAEYHRLNITNPLIGKPATCTMKRTTELVGLTNHYGYKWPSLEDLHRFCFQKPVENAHDALADVKATVDCYFYIKQNHPGIF